MIMGSCPYCDGKGYAWSASGPPPQNYSLEDFIKDMKYLPPILWPNTGLDPNKPPRCPLCDGSGDWP